MVTAVCIHGESKTAHYKLAHNFPIYIVATCLRCGKKVKGSAYSITERRVPELIPVLGSQPAGDVNHKPGV